MSAVRTVIKETPLAILLFIILVPVLVLLSPIILGFALYVGYDKMWERIRKDPKISFDHPKDDRWFRADSIVSFQEHFQKVTNFVADHAKAKKMSVKAQGLRLEQRIVGAKCELMAIYTLEKSKDNEDQSVYADYYDYDSQSDFLSCTIILKYDAHEYKLFMNEPIVFWFAINALKNGVNVKHNNQQLWVKDDTHDVWIVKYSTKQDNYGLRKTDKASYARRFWFDK